MYWGKVISAFFIIMALTTGVGFIYAASSYELIIATAMNLIATTLKLGSRSRYGPEILATSFAADLHLIPAVYIYFVSGDAKSAQGLVLGSVVANIISLIFVIIGYIRSDEEM